MFKTIALASVLALQAPAATFFHQEIQEYTADLYPIVWTPAEPANYELRFGGPSGDKHFRIFADAVYQMILGSLGKVVIVGSTTAHEWVLLIDYTETPYYPTHPTANGLPVDAGFDHFYDKYLDRVYDYFPIVYIQYGMLFAQMRTTLIDRTATPWAISEIAYTHNYGIEMGVQAIPEPATLGLFAAGCAIVVLMRRRR